MKVIADTGNGFLLEVTSNELAQILGFRGEYDSDYKINRNASHIGLTYDIGKIVKTAQYVRNLDADVLSQSHERLLAMAERVNEVRDLVHKLNIFEDLKQQADKEPA